MSRGRLQAPSDTAQAARLAAFGYEAQLRRSLSLADLLVYGLVFISPIAPFAIFGVVFNASRGLVPLTYVIGLAAMVFTAISYREMSIAFPISGSVYSYAGRGLHPSAGFLAGWAVLLDYLLLPTLAYVVSAAAMRAIVPSIPQAAWVLLFIASNTTVNLLGIETTARASKIFLAMQHVVIALFILLGVAAIASGVNGAHWSLEPFWTPRAFHVSFVFNALSVAVLSFLGFDAISTLAEEATGGGKAVGQATMISLCLAAILFIAQTWLRRSWSPAGPSLSATRRSTTPSTRSPPSRVGQRSSSSLRSRSPCQRVSPMRWWRRRPPRGCCLRWRAMVNAPPGSVVSQPPLKRSDHLLSRAVKSCTPYNHE